VREVAVEYTKEEAGALSMSLCVPLRCGLCVSRGGASLCVSRDVCVCVVCVGIPNLWYVCIRR
jgi:hypothetical protein